MTTDKTPATLAEPRSHRWNDVGERCLDCGDKDWMGGPCSGPRLEAAGSPWVTISTAPNDGRPHIRGLWVTSRIEDRPDTREWRQFIGLINDDGDFVDPDYGESFGWDADQYDAWMPVADAPSATLATAKHGGCVQLGNGRHVLVLREMRAQFTDAGSPARTAALDEAIAVLSAQPSPGGQGDALVTDAMVEAAHSAYWAHPDDSGEDRPCMRAALEAALTARQPVGEPVAWVPAKFFDKGIVAMTARRTPPSAMAVELHGKYVPLFDAPPAQQPAQAVDLGPVRDVFRQWHANDLNSTDAMLALVEALAVIDSQAVGK